MPILLIAALLLAGGLALRHALLKRELRRTARTLEARSLGETEEKVYISLFDRDLTRLASAINADIDRERLEHIQRRRQTDALMDAVAGISHDLRTPLTSVMGYLQLLEKSGVEERQLRYLATARDKANTLSRLVTDFYEMTRLEAGQDPLEIGPVDLGAALSDCLLAHADDLRAGGMEPRLHLPPEPAVALADGQKLQRVLDNLVDNAVKHGNGYLDVALETEGEMRIQFANGLPEDSAPQAERVFDRFYSGDQARNRAGSGLGLYVVKALVERMGGRVRAEAEHDRFTITVSLPASEAP